MNLREWFGDAALQMATMPPALVLVLKVTLLLAAAWMLWMALGRANPRWRVFAWRAAVVGMALLPLGTIGLLDWKVSVARREVVVGTEVPSSGERAGIRIAVPTANRLLSDSVVPTPARGIGRTASLERPREAKGPRWVIPWELVLLGVWGLGVVLGAVRLGIAYFWLGRLMRDGKSASEDIVVEVEKVAAALGCRGKIGVQASRRFAVPMLCGARRPLLVLPERMCEPAYRDALPGILAHELAHVRSRDWGWNVAMQAASIVLWFHPLAWRMAAAQRAACDAVCDAVSAGYVGDVRAYCRTLARVALENVGALPIAGLAMARSCDVRRRIAILDRKVFCVPLGRRAVLGFALVGLVGLGMLAGVRLAVAEPQTPAKAGESKGGAKRESEGNRGGVRQVGGRIVDESGKAIAGADVWLSVWCKQPGDGPHDPKTQHLASTVSDVNGRFAMEVPADWVAQMAPKWPTTVWGWRAGRQVGTVSSIGLLEEARATDLVVRLKSAAKISFTVLDAENKPVVGALVQPYRFGYEETPEEMLRKIQARTDGQGRATLSAVGREELIDVRVVSKDLGVQIPSYSSSEDPMPAENTLRLCRVGRIEGKILADKAEWVRGIRIALSTHGQGGTAPPWHTEGFAEVESDREGRFVVPAIAEGWVSFRYISLDRDLPVRPQLPGMRDDVSSRRSRAIRAGETKSWQIPMVHLVPVRGRVQTTDTGKAIAGVEITPDFYPFPVPTVRSDARGIYTAHVLAGPVSFHAFDESEKHIQVGDAPAWEVPEQSREFELPPLELTPAKAIEGRVVDDKDHPIGDAHVNILKDSRRYGFGKSDPEGRFRLTRVPATFDTATAPYEVSLPGKRLSSVDIKAVIVTASPLMLRVFPGVHGDETARPLDEAVRAINREAVRLPETRGLEPLTDAEVLQAIGKIDGNGQLWADEIQELKKVARSRRLPKNFVLRQFVRYNDGSGVQHGWWVRLIVMRENHGPAAVSIREESLFRRPYTQAERQQQEEFGKTKSIPFMGRLVAYFDEDPKFGTEQQYPVQEAKRLADAVRKAIEEHKLEELLALYHWDRVDKLTRTSVRAEAEKLVKRKLTGVSGEPRRFGGELKQYLGLQFLGPNLPVLGYVLLNFGDRDGPKTVSLEFGASGNGLRLVNTIVTKDERPGRIGKPISRPMTSKGFITPLGEPGWFDFFSENEVSEEFAPLRNANLELLKINVEGR